MSQSGKLDIEDGKASSSTANSQNDENVLDMSGWLLLVCILIAILLLCIPVTPLLFIFISLLRLVQLIVRGNDYEKVTAFKATIRMVMFLNMVPVLIAMGIFYPIAKYVGGVKQVLVIGLPFTEWVKIGCMLSGFYMLNFILSSIFTEIVLVKLIKSTWGSRKLTETGDAISELISCFLFWCAELETRKRLPALKVHLLLGLHAHTWIQILVLVLVGYNLIRIAIYGTVWLIWSYYWNKSMKSKKTSKKNNRNNVLNSFWSKTAFSSGIVYCAIGIRRSVIFMLSSLFVLLMWVLYIADLLNQSSSKYAAGISDFGTRTCVSLLVWSLLWFVKSCILLSWEAHSVYNRLSPQIVRQGRQLYFLQILKEESDDDDNDNDNDNDNDDNEKENKYCSSIIRKFNLFDEEDENGCTLYDLSQIVRCLLKAMGGLSDDECTKDILSNIFGDDAKDNVDDDDDGSKMKVIKDKLKEIIFSAQKNNTTSTRDSSSKINDWEHFEKLLKDMTGLQPTHDYTKDHIETSLEGYHRSCYSFAKSLLSAREVADCLNKIISVVVLFGVFVLWLLLTGIANTQVLVLIGSPLVAATFIFGDSCKSAFQGIIFVYVLEPFNIGDLCVIDEQLMEVHSVGVRKTIFKIVETQVEVIYPNSELANKIIYNHKTEFDLNENLEFDVGHLDNRKIETLKQSIESHLLTKDVQDIIKRNSQSVSILTTREWMKVVVRFKYQNNQYPAGWTFFSCLQKRDELRSQFAVKIKELIGT